MINKPQDNDTERSRCERHRGGVKGVLLSQARAPRGGERHPGVRGRPGGCQSAAAMPRGESGS